MQLLQRDVAADPGVAADLYPQGLDDIDVTVDPVIGEAVSALYLTPPWGKLDQPAFLNAAVRIVITSYSIHYTKLYDKDKSKGSGMGLSMVYGFAKQSGGHLALYSEPGHGTTMNLYLPQARARTEATETPRPRTAVTGKTA